MNVISAAVHIKTDEVVNCGRGLKGLTCKIFAVIALQLKATGNSYPVE